MEGQRDIQNPSKEPCFSLVILFFNMCQLAEWWWGSCFDSVSHSQSDRKQSENLGTVHILNFRVGKCHGDCVHINLGTWMGKVPLDLCAALAV